MLGFAWAKTAGGTSLFVGFAAIFGLALAVRLVIVTLFATEPRNDLLWSDAVGWNLATGHGFTASQREPRVPGIYRTPGYPAFLALIYSLFGRSHAAVYAAQVVLDSASAVLIGIIALRLATTQIGVLAGLLYALYPYAAFFCGILHQDILLVFATLVILFLLTWVGHDAANASRWAVVGIAAGLTALVKANFALFAVVPVLTIWLGVPWQRRRTLATVAFVIGMSAALAPWIIRNYVTFRAFPPLAAGATGTNLMYLLDELESGEEAMVTKLMGIETNSERYLDRFVDGHALITAERERATVAAGELLRRWPEYLLLIGYHVPRLWITRRSLNQPSVLGVMAFALSWPVLLLGLAGMWAARRHWPHNLPLYSTVLTITAMYAPYTAEARYTLPARPAMLVFVAYALLAAVDLRRARRNRWDRGAGNRFPAA